jgi:hypothetical protein
MPIGRKTGGRKPGSKNKRTLAMQAQAQETAEKIKEALGTDAAFAGDAHALLMAVYKNEQMPMEMRLDAAKSAVRYEKPALSSVDQKGDTAPRYIAYLPQVSTTPEEWLSQHGHLKGETETRQ